MRRRLIVVAAAAMLVIAGALAWQNLHFRWRSRCGRAALLARSPAASIRLGGSDAAANFSGYVEADYVMVTSSIGGTLMTLDVARGDQSQRARRCSRSTPPPSAPPATKRPPSWPRRNRSLRTSASARRQPEIDAIVAQRAQAEAALRQSQADFRAPDAAARDARLQPETTR